jgi:hypothetical protein
MHCWYDHELSIVEDCLNPCLNNNSDLVNGIVIFYTISLQLSWYPVLQKVKIMLITIRLSTDYHVLFCKRI